MLLSVPCERTMRWLVIYTVLDALHHIPGVENCSSDARRYEWRVGTRTACADTASCSDAAAAANAARCRRPAAHHNVAG